MTVMTRQQQKLLDQLMSLAGSSEVVLEALRSLDEESTVPPDFSEIVRRILEIRLREERMTSAAHGQDMATHSSLKAAFE